jgi:Mg-chelatase subunit ChlD
MSGWLGWCGIAAMVVAALGLAMVRSARPAARWWTWLLVVVAAGLALGLPTPVAVVAPAVVASPVVGDLAAALPPTRYGTALLQAAAQAAPAAPGLVVPWVAGAPPPAGVLGATVQRPAAIGVSPADLRLHALGQAAVLRPLALQLVAPPLPAPAAATLQLRLGDAVVFVANVSLGAEPVVLPPFVPQQPGRHRVELRVDLGAHAIEAHGSLEVAPAPGVLVLEPSGTIAAALRAQGVAVTEATAWPMPRPAALQSLAAVVVGQPLPPAAQQDLVAAVLDGLGLWVLGPGLGAEAEPMRALLPVRPAPQPAAGDGPLAAGGAPGEPPPEPPPAEPPANPPPPREPPRGDTEGAELAKEPIEVDKHTIAMVLVVDRSGSMAEVLPNGRSKMSYAKTSALRTARALGAGDAVAVVTFGNKDAGVVVLPLTAATELAVVQAGIEGLAAAPEYTYLKGGLEQAYRLLATSRAAVKHIVVVSDGLFDLNEGTWLLHQAETQREQAKVSLSVISIVDGVGDSGFRLLAERLTAAGGGQFLPTQDVTSVPTFVVAEVTRALRRVGREPNRSDGAGPTAAAPPAPRPQPPAEPPAVPPSVPPPTPPPAARVVVRDLAPSPLLEPIPAGWPSLGAAIAGEATFDAQVWLVAGDAGWPLLAGANRGLGRVVVFAADLAGADGQEFRAAPSFPAWAAQWVQRVLPAVPRGELVSLLQHAAVVPPAPTPAELPALVALAADRDPRQFELAAPAPPALPPQLRRELLGTMPARAPWLLAGLVLLVWLERWLAARALRAGRGP